MIQFENSYSELPNVFYQKVVPSSAVSPTLIEFNYPLSKSLGLEELSEKEITEIFSGIKLPQSSNPIALAYAGHQFGNFVPQLGDGRAILIGELKGKNGKTFDIQLKGSGITRFSRGGDGRSALGPVLREYIVSEAMHALGIPTTRTLAAVLTGDEVYREKMLPGAISTRVASSHIRIGTFEYFAARNDIENLKVLADFAIQRHDPELINEKDKYYQFFNNVSKRQLSLIAKWMGIGFIHGVMNTDNTTISGETIDYGPCAFMDHYEEYKVFSSIDQRGRYAFKNQGPVAIWNLSCLASCLVPIVDDERKIAINKFEEDLRKLESFFEQKVFEVFSKKLGFFDFQEEDKKIVSSFLRYLESNKLDFTNTFRNLPDNLNLNTDVYQKIYSRLKIQPQSIEEANKLMNKSNPVIIPRNHLVEKTINEGYKGDFSFFKTFNSVLKTPFKDSKDLDLYKRPPDPDEEVRQTFCGT